MTELIAMIVGALSAGAVAKASDVGGMLVADAYDGLKGLIVSTLGKSGVVQSVEDEPRSETAQAVLAGALTRVDVTEGSELSQKARALHAMLVSKRETADIEFGDIFAKADITVRNLSAQGSIRVGNIVSPEGGVTISDVRTGDYPAKNR